MSRRVGSPKAVVTAATAEENSESVRVGVAVPSPCPSGGDEAGEPAELGELGAPRATLGILPMAIGEIPTTSQEASGPMAVTESDVREAAGAVEDPRLRLTLAELGMVGAVEVGGGAVRLELALPVPDHPGLDHLAAEVRRALGALDGVDSVELRSAPMDDEGRARLRNRLRAAMGISPGQDDGARPGGGGSGPGRPLGHAEGKANPFNRPGARTRVVGVSSGKGGVGKSSVTVNLAVSLARLGQSVGVLDAGVYGFSVPRMLGLDETPVVIEDLMVPPVAHGVACISMGFFVGEDQPVIWRGPMLHKALEQFLADVYWGTLDYLLIDMPPGTGRSEERRVGKECRSRWSAYH